MQTLRRYGEYLVTRLSYRNRMLKLRRQRFVFGDGGPAILEDLNIKPAGINHRLDREEHAFFDNHALAGGAEMQNAWRGVKNFPQPVAAIFAHHRITKTLRIGLDRVADIADCGAGAHLFNGRGERYMQRYDPEKLERSTRDPNRATPNWAPAEDEHWTGNLVTGTAPRVYNEPARGWWRLRVISVSGGNLQLDVMGERG